MLSSWLKKNSNSLPGEQHAFCRSFFTDEQKKRGTKSDRNHQKDGFKSDAIGAIHLHSARRSPSVCPTQMSTEWVKNPPWSLEKFHFA